LRAVTGLYSVAVFVFGQQPELVAADIPAMGQPLAAASPAQHGLVQSGGQSFGQHGLVQSGGQTFGQQPGLASPAQHGSVRPKGQAFAPGHGVLPVTCELTSDLAGKMFA